jgi:hypothetical protein
LERIEGTMNAVGVLRAAKKIFQTLFA